MNTTSYSSLATIRHTGPLKQFTIDDCRMIDIPVLPGMQGTALGTAMPSGIIPFKTKRMYYMYDIPDQQNRGGHAHKNLFQLVMAMRGSFSLVVHDGNNSKSVQLNEPGKGLLLVPGIWRELVDFTGGAICMVLASEVYDAADYIRDFESFLQYRLVTGS